MCAQRVDSTWANGHGALLVALARAAQLPNGLVGRIVRRSAECVTLRTHDFFAAQAGMRAH
ncbi:hypothetical protein WM23_20735 [Burkholderia ubonensis]|nr:hypothetical protein WM23_20735 [Burkholderia ubonensis]